MVEEVKRLKPTGETLRKLFLLSGNLCAFPGCERIMMNADGVFISQVCHIEAAEEGGQRFNKQMSNEDRRHFDNLLLMCHEHHKVTDDVIKFPVERLRQIKRDHEGRFSRPDRAMLESLKDWTELDTPNPAKNLAKLNKVLGLGLSEGELAECVKEIEKYVEKLRDVPVGLRRFLGSIARRAHKMHKTNVVRSTTYGTLILASDIEGAFQLSKQTIADQASQLESYGLLTVDQMDTALGPRPALRIDSLRESGWEIWTSIVEFCEEAAIPLEAFTDNLDFARLDDDPQETAAG